MTLTWQNGRELASITKTGLNASYVYNDSGLRISKTVNGVATEYYWDDSRLLAQKTNGEYLYFLYDENGSMIGFTLNGLQYLYVRNLQGDIVSVVSASTGDSVAEYTYDSWGNVLTATGSMAEANPIRYRGYYYDAETGLYYASNRYYDANTGRFLNADIVIDNRSLIGNNLFTYCWNNPVNMHDPTGNYAASLVLASSATAALGGALAGIMTSISASVASIKAAIATSWFIPLCVAATAIAIGGIIYVVNRAMALAATAASVIAAVQSKVKSKGVNPKRLWDNTVYVIVRKETTDVVYVGRTKNYSARKSAHQKRFPKSSYTMMPIATCLSLAQARALEQTIITAYTLDTLRNMINSIAPSKWGNFQTEFEQMLTLIESFFDPE